LPRLPNPCGGSDFLFYLALLLKRLPYGFQGGAPKIFGAFKRRCFAAPIIFSGCLTGGGK
jgi:hypothetical protein